MWLLGSFRQVERFFWFFLMNLGVLTLSSTLALLSIKYIMESREDFERRLKTLCAFLLASKLFFFIYTYIYSTILSRSIWGKNYKYNDLQKIKSWLTAHYIQSLTKLNEPFDIFKHLFWGFLERILKRFSKKFSNACQSLLVLIDMICKHNTKQLFFLICWTVDRFKFISHHTKHRKSVCVVFELKADWLRNKKLSDFYFLSCSFEKE